MRQIDKDSKAAIADNMQIEGKNPNEPARNLRMSVDTAQLWRRIGEQIDPAARNPDYLKNMITQVRKETHKTAS